MKLLVVIPFCKADRHLALTLLAWISSLGKHPDNPCLIVADAKLSKEDIQPVVKLAMEVFGSVEFISTAFALRDERWPAGANWMFETAVRHISAGSKRPFLWLEPDCVPTRATWLTEIESEYKRSKRPFMGQILVPAQKGLPDQMLSGCAVYPGNMPREVMAMLIAKRKVAWDVSCAEIITPKTHHSSLFWTFHNHATPPTFVTVKKPDSPANALALDKLPVRAALIHPCKDGSLISLLKLAQDSEGGQLVNEWRKRKVRPMTVHDYARVESFTQQTDWESGFFFFPTTPRVNTVHFNPSLVTVVDVDYLITRRSITPIMNYWDSDISIWSLGKNMIPMDPVFPTLPKKNNNEQWEDPRAVVVKDRIYMSCAVWAHFQLFKCQQVFSRLNGNALEVVAYPEYGGNSPAPARRARNEKNWTFFWHSDSWHFVYGSSPQHEVVQLDGDRLVTFKDVTNTTKLWEFGEMRGGGCPVLIGDEYLCFFHSSIPKLSARRRYFMGAYTFETRPPFRIKRITRAPLLVGSTKDPIAHGGPPCIFPGSAIYRGGTWTVPFGVNDENCGFLKIPHVDLEKRMEAV